MPYSNRIYTTFGDVRATKEQKEILNNLGIYEQLSKMHFGITGDPFAEEAQTHEDLVFTDLYKIILDGNYIIGVVLQDKDTKQQKWLFTNISSWEQAGRIFIRLEMK